MEEGSNSSNNSQKDYIETVQNKEAMQEECIEETDIKDAGLEQEDDSDFREAVNEPPAEFPDDLRGPSAEEEDLVHSDQRVSDQFINSVIEEQQDFIQVLNQAENQLMLDENFIMMISDVCNKKSDEFYFYDYRDKEMIGMVTIIL